MNKKKWLIKYKNKVSCLLCFLALIAFAVKAQPANLGEADINHYTLLKNSDHKNNADTSLDLYLLIGQSNMAGRGVITEKYKQQGNPRVFMLNKENNWVKAKNPVHFDKPAIAGVGPGLSFGIFMAKKNPKSKIGLIPCAVGGTRIILWQPGAYDKVTNTHPYDDMVARLKEAQKSGTLRGVLWLQGGSDSSPEAAEKYMERLKELIERIRSLAENNELPFVAGELGRYREQNQNINNVLKNLSATVPYTGVASSRGLKDKGDNTHFDSESATKMGKRMAREMQRLTITQKQ